MFKRKLIIITACSLVSIASCYGMEQPSQGIYQIRSNYPEAQGQPYIDDIKKLMKNNREQIDELEKRVNELVRQINSLKKRNLGLEKILNRLG